MEIVQTRVYPSIEGLRRLQNTIRSQGGSDIALRIEDLIDRLESGNRQVFVAFCGLFSAGKSSLLNALCESQMLATGAVPTTAQTHEIELPGTNHAVVLIDTPGVDSTDESHQQETEAALHRADIIALVMDYQHVESEANLDLARRFTDLSQRFILVVNQVDKHLEWELPFSTFTRRVEQTLQDWDVQYERIYYTASNEDSKHNQLPQLTRFLKDLVSDVDAIGGSRIHDRLRDLLTEHVNRLMETTRTELEDELALRIGYVPFDDDEANALKEERTLRDREITSALDDAREQVATWFDARRAEFTREVELAQIAPYETTERGRLYVESLRSDFKVGWFNAKQKTESERMARLDTFVKDISERTEKYLLWPLKNRIREALHTNDLFQSSWLEQVDELDVRVTPELCTEQIKSGALVSTDYPYQYVKDVVGVIKQRIRTQINERVNTWQQEALKLNDLTLSPHVEEHKRIQSEIQLIDSWLDLDRQKAEKIAALMQEGGDER